LRPAFDFLDAAGADFWAFVMAFSDFESSVWRTVMCSVYPRIRMENTSFRFGLWSRFGCRNFAFGWFADIRH